MSDVEKAKGEPKAGRSPSLPKPSGRGPDATVSSRHGPGTVVRQAKGFSLDELSAAGIPDRLAARWRIHVDVRRRSALEPNISALRRWTKTAAESAPREGEVMKVEKELGKAAKAAEAAVRKEASRAKKEVKKVEKEVSGAVKKPAKAKQRRKKPAKK